MAAALSGPYNIENIRPPTTSSKINKLWNQTANIWKYA